VGSFALLNRVFFSLLFSWFSTIFQIYEKNAYQFHLNQLKIKKSRLILSKLKKKYE